MLVRFETFASKLTVQTGFTCIDQGDKALQGQLRPFRQYYKPQFWAVHATYFYQCSIVFVKWSTQKSAKNQMFGLANRTENGSVIGACGFQRFWPWEFGSQGSDFGHFFIQISDSWDQTKQKSSVWSQLFEIRTFRLFHSLLHNVLIRFGPYIRPKRNKIVQISDNVWFQDKKVWISDSSDRLKSKPFCSVWA